MREILYKAQRKDTGEWVEGFPYFGDYSGAFILQNKAVKRRNARTGTITLGDEVVPIEVDGSTYCQYTGKTDTNGTMAYELDKIYDPHENRIFTIKWDAECMGFVLQDDEGWENKNIVRLFYCEVIGNVYDKEGNNENQA